MPAAIIGYIRVSTDKQGKSGLGLEAQREAVARFAAAEALEVAGEFIEAERRVGQASATRGSAAEGQTDQGPHRCVETRPVEPRCAFHFGPDVQTRSVRRRGARQ